MSVVVYKVRSVSGIRANRESLSTHSKASLVLLPFFGVAITTHASAQVISAGDGSSTVIEANGDQFDITGGQLSSEEANLFHNFEQFGLSSGQTANFETIPKVQNVIGNVSGGQASTIDGTLQVSGSEANLYLMNPAGILMGPDAQLNLSGGFTATTATGIGFEDGQFNAQTSDYGRLTGTPASFQFSNEQAGTVVNTGDLSVDEGNSINLIGGTVVNAGSLSAPEGTVTIAAVEGERRVRISQGDQLLSLEVEAGEPSQTIPQISAQSIGSMLTGSGLTEATALIAEPDGTVRLGSAVVDESGGQAIAGGSLSTFGKTGGDINVLGNQVGLIDARLDASGVDGGGLVRIGGDYRGEGSVANAIETLFDQNSVVTADALESGDGGRVIVWADDTAKFYGSISATGGASAGNGGFVEISGKNLLSTVGKVDLSALKGDFGTVLLDPENLVITDEFPIPPDDGSTSYLSSAYVEDLSNGANVELEATNDFTISSLADGELLFDEGRSVTFKADSDGVGGGAFSMDAGDTIRAERGDVFISGAGITTGIIDTSTDKEDEHGSDTDVFGGDVELRSSLEISATEILTYGQRDGNHSGNGGNVFLEALGGDVVVTEAIKTYSQTDKHESGFGGSIRVEASNSIRVGTDTSTEDILDTSSRADDHTSRIGGDIWLNAGADITVWGGISTRSRTYEEQRVGSLYEQGGGQIELRAGGSISTQNIISASDAGVSSDTNISNAGNGGSILLEAGTDISTGFIDTISVATGGANSGLAGNVSLKAGGEIETQGISTDSVALSGAGQAGAISLSAQTISVEGRISGLSEDSTVRRTKSAAIQLLGNAVRFGDGPNSVEGSTIEIAPLDAFRNVDVGSSTDSESELRITDSELAAIGNNVEKISIGREDSAGSVRLANSVTSADAYERAPINILGAKTLLGSNEDTVYNINNIRSGSIVGSGSAVTTFSDVYGIRGGNGEDLFVITPGVPASSFEELTGGDGNNVLDYTNFTVGIDVPLSGLSDLKVLASENAGQMNRLTGKDTNSTWRISGVGSGKVDTLSEQVEFEGFSYLSGGTENDQFVVEENGNIRGIRGGGGENTIDYSIYGSTVEVDLSSRRTTGIDTFRDISRIVGSSEEDVIAGTVEDDIFKITVDRAGEINGLAFERFERISGKGGEDTLDYSEYGSSVEIDLGNSVATGLSSFSEIESAIGSANEDLIKGTSGDDVFKIVGDRTGSIDDVFSFSNFETVDGGNGTDRISLVTPVTGSRNLWTISQARGGLLSTGRISFENFEELEGNADNDLFEILENGYIERVLGNGNLDTISFRNNSNATFIDLQNRTARNALSSLEFSEVENFVGSEDSNNTISGADSGSRWEIVRENMGFVDNNVAFTNFYKLLGKDGDDTFLFYDGGVITGQIEGGGGDDRLDYSNYERTVELSLASSSIYNSLNQFLLIENVVGNGTASILGGDRDTDWEISGTDSGFVEGLSFREFNRLVGGVKDDGFNFVGDGEITGYIVGGSGTGTDILDYENHTSAVEIYPDRVLGEEGSFVTNQFLEIEKVIGDKETSVLHSYDMRNRFEVQQDGSVRIGDLAAVNIASVSGSGENAVLDYSGIDRAIAVDLENSKIFDGLNLGFENISRIVGDDSYENALIGTDGDDRFEIVGDREIRTGELLLSQFSSIDGSEGINQFVVNGESASSLLIKGGSDTLTSQNSISSEVSDANWQISGKNTGRLEGPTSTILAEFSQIQKLENSTTDGTHQLTFTMPDSQITGGINSGKSDLILIGDDINIGHGNGNNLVDGEIAGTGTLTILSESVGVDIELGGSDSRGAALNITDGEIAAIQDSFSNLIIGDRDATRRVLLKDDVSFNSAVELRSSAEVNAGGNRLAANGVLIESDRITVGTIDSRDSVLLVAQSDIAAEAISATGSGIEIASAAGSISVEGGIETSSGGVELDAQNTITVGFIDATGTGTNSTGFIKIETAEDFAATEYIPGTRLSLSTAGAENGSIDIRYGNQSRPEKPFLVGQESSNGTVGGIRAALEIVSGDVPNGTSQGGITIVDRGYQLAEPRTPVVPLKIVEPLTEQSLVPELSVVEGGREGSKEILRSLETEMNEGFETYLNLRGESTKRLATTLEDMQQTLREVEETTDTKSSLVYVYFVPDAASERAVSSKGDEVAAADDQLEVMLINGAGEPVRKRQWGVTRAQVEAASLDLRQQITSQFTTASQYLKPAQQLYDWIMRPLANTLREEQVESVGFVMDTGLRTMPLAALHDGDRYLVEDYSLGLLPTFSLTKFQSDKDVDVDLKEARVLAMGASKFEEQPDLPAVDAELALITQELWEGDAFVNEDFVLKNLQTQIEDQDYGVVHLATHASFESGDLEQSYIQLWDEKLALDDVGELGLDRSNVSLIILSACNTALGDQASEYGFAGFAVASGSQSALASLWPVNDEGTLGFMSQFYTELKQAPVRADALRQAQISLIRGEVGIDSGVVYDAIGDEVAVLPSLAESGRWDFSHPFFWSAFTMIGNPW